MKRQPASAPSIDPATIAGRLRKAREDLGLSQVALAKSAGISRSAIVRYEKAEVVPGGLKLSKLAEALGMSPNELLSGTDAYFPSQQPEHALAGRSLPATYIRVTMCLMALEPKIQEEVSALLLAMVEAKKSKAEFAEFLEAIQDVNAAIVTTQPQINQATDHAAREITKRKRK
jgi:transcriptional regulator with XRE-family HTH domain